MVIKETEMQRFKDCPICLETFSEGEAVIVILCNHKFHYKCLREWRDQTCPVCRYQQYPFELTFCEKCDIHQDLWCCIICGFIGCGGLIPISGHMQEHAIESHHVYSKPIIRDLSSGRQKGIFDHSTTDFIHSISYSNQTGSIIAADASPPDKKEKKEKDIGEEINQLISSTLDSQRQFYKQEMKKLEAEFDKVKKDSTEMCHYIQSDIQVIQGEIESLNILIAEGSDSLNKLNGFLEALNEKLEKLRKENQRLKKAKKQQEDVIDQKREAKRAELSAIKRQIAEKLAEVKDMKVHIENKKKIDSLPVQQGSSIMLLETGGKKNKK